jgi:hypothetical protein
MRMTASPFLLHQGGLLSRLGLLTLSFQEVSLALATMFPYGDAVLVRALHFHSGVPPNLPLLLLRLHCLPA